MQFSRGDATPAQRKWNLRIRESDGQSLLEFALLTPIILVLLVGVIEVGRFAYLSILTANAARAGVQYGAQSLTAASDGPGMAAAALNDAQNIPGMTVPVTRHFCSCASSSTAELPCPAICGLGDHALVYVQVQTNGTFTALFHYPGLPATFPVNGNAVMRVAQ
ncbi:MAG: TadE family protein [Candidatus Acidiferrales bacterium]